MTDTSRRNLQPASALPQQMVFDLFRGASPEESIDKSTSEIGYLKAQALFDMGDMSLLGRRLLDAIYWFVSEKISTAGDTSVSNETSVAVTDYDLSFDYLKWLMRYDSRNVAHVRLIIRECQKSSIEVLDERSGRYKSVPLLGPAGVDGNRMTFSLSPEMLRLLKDSESRTFLSIRITAGFSSSYAHALYTLLLLSRDRGETDWVELAEFRRRVGATAKSFDQFGELTRVVIKIALSQINELSDLHVKHETKAAAGGKKVTHIRFLISENASTSSRLLATPRTIASTIEEMLRTDFGLSASELAEIAAQKWDNERILDAVALVRKRQQGKKIAYPGKYLMTAIREGYRVAGLEKELPEDGNTLLPSPSPKVKKAGPKRASPAPAGTTGDVSAAPKLKAARVIETVAQEADAALVRFQKLKADKRQSLLDEFLAGQKRITVRTVEEILASRLQRGRFLVFLGERLK
jgi:hypothetical protein